MRMQIQQLKVLCLIAESFVLLYFKVLNFQEFLLRTSRVSIFLLRDLSFEVYELNWLLMPCT